MRIVTSSSAALGGMGAKLRSVMCGAGSMSDNGGHRSGDASHSSGFCSGSWMRDAGTAEQLCAQGGSHLTCVTAHVGYARDSAHESVVCRLSSDPSSVVSIPAQWRSGASKAAYAHVGLHALAQCARRLLA